MTSFSIYLIRHENRFDCATNDCSLTSDGLYSAEFDIPAKIDAVCELDRINPSDLKVYCSPTLRTLQTIWFYCREKNLRIHILEIIHETLANSIAHYIQSSVPTSVAHYNVYSYALNQISMIIDQVPEPTLMTENDPFYDIFSKCIRYRDMIPQDDFNYTLCLSKDEIRKIPQIVGRRLRLVKTGLQMLLMGINSDSHTYVSKNRDHPSETVNRVMSEINACLLEVDQALSEIQRSKFEFVNSGLFMRIGMSITDRLWDISKSLCEFDIQPTCDPDPSDFRINDYREIIKNDGYTSEDASLVKSRTDLLVQKIISTESSSISSYRNAIYVSHALPIAAIIVGIYEKYGIIDQLEVEYGFESKDTTELITELDTKIRVGQIHRLRINLEHKTIEHTVHD